MFGWGGQEEKSGCPWCGVNLLEPCMRLQVGQSPTAAVPSSPISSSRYLTLSNLGQQPKPRLPPLPPFPQGINTVLETPRVADVDV